MNVALVAALLALTGALVVALVAFTKNRQVVARAERDQAAGLLRWAAELAMEPYESRAVVGVAVLSVLRGSARARSVESRAIEAVAEVLLGR